MGNGPAPSADSQGMTTTAAAITAPTDEQVSALRDHVARGDLSHRQLSQLLQLVNLIGIQMQMETPGEYAAYLKADRWDAIATKYAELVSPD